MDTRVSIKGQVVIPVELRRKYGIEPGVLVRFLDTGDGLLLKPVTQQSLERLRGVLKGRGGLAVLIEERILDGERGK